MTGFATSSPWCIELHEYNILIRDAILKGIAVKLQHVTVFICRRNDS